MTVSTADQQRAWRASKGARTGRPGRPVTQPHGTPAGYKRHRKAGEEPCGPCRQAESARQAELYRKRKAQGR